LTFDFESREFSARWNTELKAWKIEIANHNSNLVNNLDNIEPLDLSEENDDGLPFLICGVNILQSN
jgi:hypothetical protein